MIQKLCISALLLSAVPAFAEQDIIRKQFDVKPGGTLLMAVDRGSVKILTSNSEKMEIEVLRELKRGTAEQAREAFEQHQIHFTQDGETVRIEAGNPGLTGLKNLFSNYRVEYTINLPTEYNLDLKTAGGSISVEDLEGKIKARTTGGSITVGRVAGDVAARTSGGGISLDQVKGAVDAQTTGGGIKIASAGGAVKAITSGGSVSAEISNEAPGECTLKTSGGGIKVTVPEKIAVDLDASTTGGRVNSDFEGEFNRQRTKLVAKLNGGGPPMRVQTSGGSIDIRRK